MSRFRMAFTDADRRAAAAARVGVTATEREALIGAGLKWCWRCGAWLPRAAFGPNRDNRDGLQTMCAECRRAYQREQGRVARRVMPGVPR